MWLDIKFNNRRKAVFKKDVIQTQFLFKVFGLNS